MPLSRTRRYTRKAAAAAAVPLVWVVVADAARARFFQVPRDGGDWVEVADLIDADARLRDADARSDRAGRIGAGSRRGTHAFEPRRARTTQEADRFASRLCRRLAAARRAGKLARVHLVADPAFLGVLRKHLDDPTQTLLGREIAADLSRRSIEVIRKALQSKL